MYMLSNTNFLFLNIFMKGDESEAGSSDYCARNLCNEARCQNFLMRRKYLQNGYQRL